MQRYYRNIRIGEIGTVGQGKLKQSKVLVVGSGGLGSPVLLYLAAAGVGTIGIIDNDDVDISNLQRQIIHFTPDIGKQKVNSAKEKLNALNPEVDLITFHEKFIPDNAQKLVKAFDFVVDCCDNYETKFLINDICVSENKAYSHGAVKELQGEVMTYVPGNCCYRCIFNDPPVNDKNSENGILGPVAGIIGSIQAAETIKYLTGIDTLLLNRILLFDGKTMNFQSLNIKKNQDCNC